MCCPGPTLNASAIPVLIQWARKVIKSFAVPLSLSLSTCSIYSTLAHNTWHVHCTGLMLLNIKNMFLNHDISWTVHGTKP